MGIFDSRSKKQRMTSLMMAIAMAQADGEISPEEAAACALVAGRLGLTVGEFRRVLQNPGSVAVTPPDDRGERALCMLDLRFVAGADGVLDPSEAEMIGKWATLFGFSGSEIELMTDCLAAGDSFEQIADRFR